MGSKFNNTDRIGNLEADLAKLREETEANRIENAMQFQEILKAISDLKGGPEKEKIKNNKEPKIEFGNFSDSEEEERSVGSGKGKSGGKYKDPLRDCRKIQIPTFEGLDAHGWIYQMERYFEIQGIRERDQLRAAAICMEGEALSWFRWNEARTPCRSWEGLKRRLLDRFQESQEGNVYEQFLSIRQEGTVREYVRRFESLAGQLLDLPEKVLESTFIKGLKPDIRSALRVMEPETLAKAMRIAIKVDENKNGGGTKPTGNPYTARGGSMGPTRTNYTSPITATNSSDKKPNTSGVGGSLND